MVLAGADWLFRPQEFAAYGFKSHALRYNGLSFVLRYSL
jgi:hypothetical protein